MTLESFERAAEAEFGAIARSEERPERYRALPAVRIAAAAQGFPQAFIDAWEPRLDSDEQPDFNTLWSMMQADFARSKGKARGDRPANDDDL